QPVFIFSRDSACTRNYSVSWPRDSRLSKRCKPRRSIPRAFSAWKTRPGRSEEHTSELQSRENLVCRLLLEKKKKKKKKKKIKNKKIKKKNKKKKHTTITRPNISKNVSRQHTAIYYQKINRNAYII